VQQTNAFSKAWARRISLLPRALLCVILLAAFARLAHCEEPCATCGDTPFPDAAAFLASQGFPADKFAVLMTWNETAPADHTSVVFGYHVLPSDGSDVFDLYSDVSGRLVAAERLAALGIVRKDWNLRPQETPPETSRTEAAAMPNPPVPLGLTGAGAPAATVDLPGSILPRFSKKTKRALLFRTRASFASVCFRTCPGR